MEYLNKLSRYFSEGKIPATLVPILEEFFRSYTTALKQRQAAPPSCEPILLQFLDLVVEQIASPYSFDLFHKKITAPTDYYTFGIELMRPLVDFASSSVVGMENLERMVAQTTKGENVILFANHQIEPDPQVISLLLEKTHPHFAAEMIFVAGHRVIQDPLAIPFSMGRNLLCIHSKKHIDTPPEEKEQKLLHNQRTMKRMKELLMEGGKCIYVAPSGGRDRRNPKGEVEISPFDPQSIEMFWLMARQAKRPTHFYHLALATYDLLPPPQSVEEDLGERREASCSPVHIAFGEEIDMENFPGKDQPDKKQRRQLRADYIQNLVTHDYERLIR